MSDDLTAAIQHLLSKQAITECLHTYSRAVDRQDIDLLRSTYHPDATDDHGAFSGPIDAFLHWVERGWRTGILAGTNHMITNVLIEFDGPDAAIVESYFFAHHTWNGADGVLDDFMGGRYLDRFERRDGAWKVATRRCAWDWGRSEPVTDDAWFRRVRGQYSWGRPDRTDPSYDPR